MALTSLWTASATYASGVTSGAFAFVEPGIRATALGGTGVADPRGAEALSWNPAALAFFRLHHLDVSYADLHGLGLVHHMHAGITAPLGKLGAGGLEVRYHGVDGFDREEREGAPEEPTYREISYAYSYANQAGPLAFGLTARLETARGTLESDNDASATGGSLDLGLMWNFTPRARIGVLARNAAGAIWWQGSSGSERPPLATILGLAIRDVGFPGIRWLVDVETGEERAGGPVRGVRRISSGLEWVAFDDRLSLRAGSALRDENRLVLTGGFGILTDGLTAAYALRLDPDALGTTHQFGVGLDW